MEVAVDIGDWVSENGEVVEYEDIVLKKAAECYILWSHGVPKRILLLQRDKEMNAIGMYA